MNARKAPTRSKPIEIFEPDEVHRMAAAAGASTTGKRNAAVLAVLFGAGLRVGEAIALQPGDVDLKRARVHVRRGKGAKERSAKVVPAFLPYLAAWIDERKSLRFAGGAPLFATITTRRAAPHSTPSRIDGSISAALARVEAGTKRGQPLSRQSIDATLRRLASKVGIEKRANPHALRHSHLALAHEQGVPLEATRAQAGHASLEVHSVYISHLANRAQDEAFDGLDWRANGEERNTDQASGGRRC